MNTRKRLAREVKLNIWAISFAAIAVPFAAIGAQNDAFQFVWAALGLAGIGIAFYLWSIRVENRKWAKR